MKSKGLTIKQQAVIREVVKDVKEGKKFSVANATERIYNVGSRVSARAIATQNLSSESFRNALLDALEKRKILGAGGKIQERLEEGLDAQDDKGVDYKTRLAYVQEINKIAGVYAPDKKETRSMKLNLNMDASELEEKIKSLQDELRDV